MYTKKKLANIRATLSRIEKCGGFCTCCKHMIVTCQKSRENGRFFYIGVGCDLAPDFNPIANGPKTLHSALIDQLKFELKVGG